MKINVRACLFPKMQYGGRNIAVFTFSGEVETNPMYDSELLALALSGQYVHVTILEADVWLRRYDCSKSAFIAEGGLKSWDPETLHRLKEIGWVFNPKAEGHRGIKAP